MTPGEKPVEIETAQRTSVERLVEVIQQLSLARNIQDVQGIVRTAARELTGADGATIVLREQDLCYYADEDAISPLWKGRRFPLNECISGWVILNARAAVIPDIYSDERIPHDVYRPTFVKSLAMVPIRQLRPLGAIGNYWATERTPTPSEVTLLQALADSTAVAMESIGIRELSMTDELTGLLNRRGFFSRVEGHLGESTVDGAPFSLVFADLDGVKRTNHEQGHRFGDQLIRAGADVLRQALGDDAVIGRVGGDEFLAVCPGNVATGQLQKEIGEIGDRVDGGVGPVSISVGAVTYSSSGEVSLDELIHAADRRMYEQKHSSRFRSRSR
jgi:diguanylate cyclase (GGDEF)-like protein